MSDTGVSSETLRQALRAWPSGVAIVTASHGNELRGLTVSSLTSVSLEPPLLSVCCDLGARTLPTIRSSGRFGVSVLSHEQAELSKRFASEALEDVRFEGVEYAAGSNGCPLLHGAAGHLECSVFAIHPAGDHQIVVGLVKRASNFDRAPLVYHDGGYRTLA